MKLPKIDLKELKKFKEKNFKERIEFLEKYTEWLKKTPNKKWSSQQKKIIEQLAKVNKKIYKSKEYFNNHGTGI